jgi:protein SHQ1
MVDTRNILEVSDPAATPLPERELVAEAFEEERWDEGYYMENFLDQEGEVAYLLQYAPNLASSIAGSSAQEMTRTATPTPTPTQTNEVSCLLIELLSALSYDDRTNEGEQTVESGWTIAKLSRSLSASASASDSATLEAAMERTVRSYIRRVLTVPLYRHWELALQCLHDAASHLCAGRQHMRYCLEQILLRLETHQDPVLSRLAQIWIEPLLSHILPDEQLMKLGNTLLQMLQESSVVSKASVSGDRWDLEVLEEAAKRSLETGQGGFV